MGGSRGGGGCMRVSAVSDCAMVRKVKVTNGMQELRTKEDSLELRQVGSW